MTRNAREDLSRTPISEESPVRTPLTELYTKPSIVEAVNVVRKVNSPPDSPEQKLPVITIQYPTPEIKEEMFEREMMNEGKQPLANGWHGDYIQGREAEAH